ncbi:MAG: aldo/keto reductase [Saprospiraceae bacterium]|nr:aldo/keto reductase [Saprospiraceae bacterium]
MERVQLSEGSLQVSPIVAGTWKWGAWGHRMSISEQALFIKGCLEQGVTTFDLADIYGDHTTEEEFGSALGSLGIPREDVQLVTKCGIKMPSARQPYPLKSYDTSADHITWSVEQSLRALRTEYIDLLLIHRPSPLMDPHEIATAFSTLRQQGKVRFFGVSNFTPSQFAMLDSVCDLITNQVEASLLHLHPFLDGTFDQAITLGRRPMIWSPFGSGKLFSLESSERVARIADAARPLLDSYGLQRLDQLYLAWLLRHPARPVPLLGTARIDRMRSALAALEVQITREDYFKLWTAATGTDVP